MLKAGKYACAAFSCLFCGLMGAAGATLGDAAMKFHIVARLLALGIFTGVAFLSWVMYNLPTWIDSVHYISYLPSFVGCGHNGTLAGAAPSSVPGGIVEWLLTHEFGASALSVPERLCFGAASAHRVMFALTLFHLAMMLLMIGADRRAGSLRTHIQHGWWILKLVAVAALILFMFFSVSNDAVVTYSWVAIVGSALFIVVQLLLFIEFAYKANAAIAESYGDATARSSRLGRCSAGIGMVLGTLLCYGATLAFFIMAYASYEGACPGLTAGITGTMVLVGLSTLGSAVAYKTRRGGLLPAAIIGLYGAYLTWSALSPMAIHNMGCSPVRIPVATEEEDEESTAAAARSPASIVLSAPPGANPREFAAQNFNWTSVTLTSVGTLHDMSREAQNVVLIGAAILALAYSTFRTASDVSGHDVLELRDDPEAGEEMGNLGAADGPIEATDTTAPYSFSVFHAILVLACMYAASIITGFEALNFHEDHAIVNGVTIYVNNTAATLWVKLVSAYFLMIIFTGVVYAGFCGRCCGIFCARCGLCGTRGRRRRDEDSAQQDTAGHSTHAV